MKNILIVARSLPIVDYLSLVPLFWLCLYFFILINNLNFMYMLLIIPLGSLLYLNILFYPWFRYYLTLNSRTKNYFSPLTFKNKILGASIVYNDTKNRVSESYNVYTDYVYSKRKSNDKLAESVFFFISHFVLFPFLRFWVLS